MAFPNRKKSGFSLVEVLIAVAVMGFLAIGLATILTNSSREQKALYEKMATLETKNLLQTVFLDPATCLSQINQTSPVLDLTGVTTTPPTPPATGPVIPMNKVAMGSAASSPIIAQQGLPLPGFPPGQMVVNKIEVTNLVMTGNPFVYEGDLEISFLSTTMVRSLKPVTLKTVFTVTPNPTLSSATIVGCGPVGLNLGPWTNITYTGTQLATQSGTVVITSCDDCGIKISSAMAVAGSCAGVPLTVRTEVAARIKYGQGKVSSSLPVSKGECWNTEIVDQWGGIMAPPVAGVTTQFRAF